jgi:hypothetical protein
MRATGAMGIPTESVPQRSSIVAFTDIGSSQGERRGESIMMGVSNYRLTDAAKPVLATTRRRQS